jgi:PAT family beta-lactamase induction signal transducer AmpG
VLAAHSAFAALLDTAVDGMIIDRVPPDGLGRANACTRAGFLSGTAAGAALFASVLPAHGLHAAAVILAAAGALAVLPPCWCERTRAGRLVFLPARPSPEAGAGRAPRRLLRRFLAPMLRRQALVLVAFCLAVEGAVAIVQLRTGLDLIQRRGWDAESLSRLQAGLGSQRHLGRFRGRLVVGPAGRAARLVRHPAAQRGGARRGGPALAGGVAARRPWRPGWRPPCRC